MTATITIERSVLEQVLDAIQELEHASTAVADKKARDAKRNLRAALAAPATAPAPTQLRQGECWPENTMAQWDYYRKLIAEGDTSSAPRDWFESLAEMRLIALPAQPAWHDAPTVPGAWICADKEHVKRTHTITPGILPVISKFGDRWYGPIPEDK